jgi:hypothetical protein
VTPVEGPIARAVARNGAVRVYEQARGRLTIEVQELRADGRFPLTMRVRQQQAEIARRAMVAERDDPDPPDRPYHDCDACLTYRSRSIT